MKKTIRYLLNGVSNPRRSNTLRGTILESRLERNPGDMAYGYAVANAVATHPGVDFRMTGYYRRKNGFSPSEVAEINETCNAFVCPLADMFSDNWAWYVRVLADLVKELRIPCVVPCVGARSLPDGTRADDMPWAGDVRRFVGAVLDKSAVLGIRGETTARFLEGLGFVRDRHFEVLGCPTLYMFGERLPELSPPVGPEAFGTCAFTLNIRGPGEDWRFIDDCARLFRSSSFVSQDFREFFYFMLTKRQSWPECFQENPAYRDRLSGYARENRMRFFLNLRPWSQFLASADFCVGHRIHGALLSLLSGTPAAVVPFESRTRELAEFHGVPLLSPVPGESPNSLKERISALDFSGVSRRQKENFPRYVAFFRKNGIPTVFDAETPEKGRFPLETVMPRRFPDDSIPAYEHHGVLTRFKVKAVLRIQRIRARRNASQNN